MCTHSIATSSGPSPALGRSQNAVEGLKKPRGGPSRGRPVRYGHSTRLIRNHVSPFEWPPHPQPRPSRNGEVTNTSPPWPTPYHCMYAPSFPATSPQLQPCYAHVAHREANDKLPAPSFSAMLRLPSQKACWGPKGERVSPLTTTTTTTSPSFSAMSWPPHPLPRHDYSLPPLYSRRVCRGLFCWHHPTNIYVFSYVPPVVYS